MMLLLDTGPIVAAAFTTERFHHECVELYGPPIGQPRDVHPRHGDGRNGLPHQSAGSPRDEASFLRGVGEGDLVPVNLTDVDYLRMAELVEQYADLPLGATDASVIALAERLGVAEVATLDRRHFTVVQPRHLDALTLLPERLADGSCDPRSRSAHSPHADRKLPTAPRHRQQRHTPPDLGLQVLKAR